MTRILRPKHYARIAQRHHRTMTTTEKANAFPEPSKRMAGDPLDIHYHEWRNLQHAIASGYSAQKGVVS